MVISVLRGPYRGREFSFTADRVTLGKSPHNDIPLPDETVSREHVEIRRDGRGYVLRDLGSTNGTFLDGAEIREAYLRTGSQVTVGQTRFRFRAVRRRVEVEPYPGEELEGLLAASAPTRLAFGLAQAVAPLDLTVLIEGEPGTGRRSLAGVIHHLSPLREAPLSVVDCAEVPAERLERHLFQAGTGVVHRTEGGTVVLVEPWETPLPLQEPLAAAIRDRRRGPAAGDGDGAAAGLPVALRFVGVTSRPLEDEVERGRLSQDLQDVLQRVRIPLVPLRERPEEVAPLAERFLQELKPCSEPLAAALVQLVSRLGVELPWYRNLQSLRDLLAAMVAPKAAPMLRALGGTALDASPFDPALTFGQSKGRWVESFERRYMHWLLARHGGNVSKAARAAEMDRKHLHRLLKRYGLR
jgi:DNA-binding NtrC family response regulator